MSLVSNIKKTCDSCRNYLSYKPINKYANGKIICGRCIQSVGGTPVWFGNIPEDALFRCRNRYKGCRKLLKYWEVPGHEENCKEVVQICPICSKKEALLPLLGHLEQDHAENVLMESKFSLMLSKRQMEKIFIYYNDDFIVSIKTVLSTNENYLNFLLDIIASSGIDCNEISIKMVIQSEVPKMNLPVSSNTQKSTDKLKHFEVLYSEVQKCRVIECEFEIDVTPIEFEEDFITEWNLRLLLIPKMVYWKNHPLKLSGCRTVLMQPEKNIPSFCWLCKVSFYAKDIYKYQNTDTHYMCSTCIQFDIEKKCEPGNTFVKAVNEKTLLDARQFECKWSCGATRSSSFLNTHEIECTFQPNRKCPVSTCTFYGTLRKIFVHYQSSHSFHDIKLYDYWQEVSENVHGTYTLEKVGHGRSWHYFASIEFVKIYCELVENEYKFEMKVCGENALNVRCFALIKHSGQKGKQVEDEFRVPTTVDSVDIKVYLCPK